MRFKWSNGFNFNLLYFKCKSFHQIYDIRNFLSPVCRGPRQMVVLGSSTTLIRSTSIVSCEQPLWLYIFCYLIYYYVDHNYVLFFNHFSMNNLYGWHFLNAKHPRQYLTPSVFYKRYKLLTLKKWGLFFYNFLVGE